MDEAAYEVKKIRPDLERAANRNNRAKREELQSSLDACVAKTRDTARRFKQQYRQFFRPLRDFYPEVRKDLDEIDAAVQHPEQDFAVGMSDFKLDEDRTTKINQKGITVHQYGQDLVVLKRFTGRTKFCQELNALQVLRHPNIAELKISFTDGEDSIIVLAFYSGGSLQEWATLHADDAEALLRALLQLADGLAAMHKAGVVHADLKFGNVLMSSALSSAQPRITDFDASLDISDRAETVLALATRTIRLCGTKGFIAPEIEALLQSTTNATLAEAKRLVKPPIDMYAVGMMLTALMQDMRVAVSLKEFSAPLEALVRGLLSVDPSKRPSALAMKQVLHPLWLRKVSEMHSGELERKAEVTCDVCFCTTAREKTVGCSDNSTHVLCAAECLPTMIRAWASTPVETLAGRKEETLIKCLVDERCDCWLPRDKVVASLHGKDLELYSSCCRQVAEFIGRRALEKEQAARAGDPVAAAVTFIGEQYLNTKCPKRSCRQPAAISFTECLALKCNACGQYFCGWCRRMYPDSLQCHNCPCFRNPKIPLWTNEKDFYSHVLSSNRTYILKYLEGNFTDDQQAEVCRRIGL